MTEGRTAPASCACRRTSLTAAFNRFDAVAAPPGNPPRSASVEVQTPLLLEDAVPEPSTPADGVRAVAAGVSRLITGNLTERERQAQLDHLAGLYAEHTDVRHPFAPLGDHVGMARAFGRLNNLATALATDSR